MTVDRAKWHMNSRLRMAISPEVLHVVKEPHPGFITCSLSCTIIDNLRSIGSIASLDSFSSRPGLLYWCSVDVFPGKFIMANCVAYYGAYMETLNVELCTYKTLRLPKICKLRHGWPVNKFLVITQLRSLFRTWLFDHWTLQLNSVSIHTQNTIFMKVTSGQFFHSRPHVLLHKI